ncbi:MAG: ABC transporter ATP-binding protein, partial [Vicinamibacterales bacterium]
YHIGIRQERYRTVRDTIAGLAARPFRRGTAEASAPRPDSTVWALDDVSFDIARGDVVGIIGRNGAGKSTLLKILSRITEPTGGFVDVAGQVTALLEVGSGFHAELTGRENIYLNAAILGMKKREIDRQLEEIVEFAEVARFVDTPVKHYSSGMYLRLAFSVAAHLRPDILMVDEVLAVGDAAFQRKCLGKMEDVGADDRTVLFVSHNLGAVKRLCRTCIVLANGGIAFHGPVAQALAVYSQSLLSPVQPVAPGGVRFRDVALQRSGDAHASVASDASFTAVATLDASQRCVSGRLYCLVDDSNGDTVAHHFVAVEDLGNGRLDAGAHDVSAAFPPLWLLPDAYTLHFKAIVRFESGEEHRVVSERILLDVTDDSGQSAGKVRSVLIPPVAWSIESSSRRPAAVSPLLT